MPIAFFSHLYIYSNYSSRQNLLWLPVGSDFSSFSKQVRQSLCIWYCSALRRGVTKYLPLALHFAVLSHPYSTLPPTRFAKHPCSPSQANSPQRQGRNGQLVWAQQFCSHGFSGEILKGSSPSGFLVLIISIFCLGVFSCLEVDPN